MVCFEMKRCVVARLGDRVIAGFDVALVGGLRTLGVDQ